MTRHDPQAILGRVVSRGDRWEDALRVEPMHPNVSVAFFSRPDIKMPHAMRRGPDRVQDTTGARASFTSYFCSLKILYCYVCTYTRRSCVL